MRQDYSTQNRVKENSEIGPPSIRGESPTSDPLIVTKKARELIENNHPVALEIFHMGRRHGLEIQESHSQIAMSAFMEGIAPNFHGEVSSEWMRLANACGVWFGPVMHQPVQPRSTPPQVPSSQGHPLDGKWIRDCAVMAWDAQAGEVAA